MKTIYVSGMFAHDWIWDDVVNRGDPNSVLVPHALCEYGPTIYDSVDAIAPFVDGPTRLVGNSMGALVSLMLAERFDDCEVVISGCPGFSPGPRTPIVRVKDPFEVATRAADMVFYDQSRITPKVVEGIASCFENNRRNVLRLMVACNESNPAEILSRLRSPVTAIWGSHDLLTPYSGAVPALGEYGVNSFVVGNCGHSPMVEKPEVFNHYLQASFDLPVAA